MTPPGVRQPPASAPCRWVRVAHVKGEEVGGICQKSRSVLVSSAYILVCFRGTRDTYLDGHIVHEGSDAQGHLGDAHAGRGMEGSAGVLGQRAPVGAVWIV